jgi:hypothetical protein
VRGHVKAVIELPSKGVQVKELILPDPHPAFELEMVEEVDVVVASQHY